MIAADTCGIQLGSRAGMYRYICTSRGYGLINWVFFGGSGTQFNGHGGQPLTYSHQLAWQSVRPAGCFKLAWHRHMGRRLGEVSGGGPGRGNLTLSSAAASGHCGSVGYTDKVGLDYLSPGEHRRLRAASRHGAGRLTIQRCKYVTEVTITEAH
jgi:hypothetical protein